MLSKEKIRQALHASRVVPLSVAKPHGPLGLEQLAAAVSCINPEIRSGTSRVSRPVVLDHKTWDNGSVG
jgi:hypothetical protein